MLPEVIVKVDVVVEMVVAGVGTKAIVAQVGAATVMVIVELS